MKATLHKSAKNLRPGVLNSWKEIACYLGRGVRTVQRWEREQHLPVHRIGSGKRSPVFAVPSELKFWLHANCGNIEFSLLPAKESTKARERKPGSPQTLHVSARRLLELTWQQKQCTERLAQTVQRLSARLAAQSERQSKLISAPTTVPPPIAAFPPRSNSTELANPTNVV